MWKNLLQNPRNFLRTNKIILRRKLFFTYYESMNVFRIHTTLNFLVKTAIFQQMRHEAMFPHQYTLTTFVFPAFQLKHWDFLMQLHDSQRQLAQCFWIFFAKTQQKKQKFTRDNVLHFVYLLLLDNGPRGVLNNFVDIKRKQICWYLLKRVKCEFFFNTIFGTFDHDHENLATSI